MLIRFWIRLGEIVLTILLVTILFVSWREDRRDRAQWATQLVAAQQALAAADARQHDRDAQLQQTLAAIAAEKRSVTSPQRILTDLPNQIPLPAPLVLQTEKPDTPPMPKKSAATAGRAASNSGPQPPTNSKIVLPAEDLKPLYDFALDCKACQAKLAAAQGNLADEKAKEAVLAKERDQAVRAAKGGSVWRRMTRAAKWFAIGAAAGAIATKSTR